MKKSKKDYPYRLTVILKADHPFGRKSRDENRSFRFKTSQEAEKEENALRKCGTVLYSKID